MSKKTIDNLLEEVKNDKGKLITTYIKETYMDDEIWVADMDFSILSSVSMKYVMNEEEGNKQNELNNLPFNSISSIATMLKRDELRMTPEVVRYIVLKFMKPLSIVYRNSRESEEQE